MRKRVVISVAINGDTAELIMKGCEEGLALALKAVKDRTNNGDTYSTGSTSTCNDAGTVSVDVTYKEV